MMYQMARSKWAWFMAGTVLVLVLAAGALCAPKDQEQIEIAIASLARKRGLKPVKPVPADWFFATGLVAPKGAMEPRAVDPSRGPVSLYEDQNASPLYFQELILELRTLLGCNELMILGPVPGTPEARNIVVRAHLYYKADYDWGRIEVDLVYLSSGNEPPTTSLAVRKTVRGLMERLRRRWFP
jgi:hypothetical protein